MLCQIIYRHGAPHVKRGQRKTGQPLPFRGAKALPPRASADGRHDREEVWAKSVERSFQQRSPPHLTSRPSPLSSLQTTSPSYPFDSLIHATIPSLLLSVNPPQSASQSDEGLAVFAPGTVRRRQIFAHPRLFHAIQVFLQVPKKAAQRRTAGQNPGLFGEKRRRAA